jgi:hypothetical protein
MSAVVRGHVHKYAEIKLRQVIDKELLETLDLERAVEHLYRTRQISDMERSVLGVACYGHSVNTGARELGISRWLYTRKLRSVCRKMAAFLGWEYSDYRVTLAAQKRLGRDLTDEEMDKLKELYRIYAPSRSEGALFDV